jgi:hypothetical protein
MLRWLRTAILVGLWLVLAGCGSKPTTTSTGQELPPGTEVFVAEVSDELGREGLLVKDAIRNSEGGGFLIVFLATQDFAGGKFRYTAYDRSDRVIKEGILQIDTNIFKGQRFNYRHAASDLDAMRRLVIQSRVK